MPDLASYFRTFTDYDGERSTMQVRAALLTAANFDAQAALAATLGSSIAAITNGVVYRYGYGNSFDVSPLPSADPTAQREMKWLVQYHGTTDLKSYRVEIPTVDFSVLDPNDRAHAEIGDAGVVDAFVTAFEAYVKADDGNGVAIDEMTLVGRNT